MRAATRVGTVAILIHDMFEDWLETVNLSLESFCTEATGSWWFNYAQALREVGVQTVLIATTTRIKMPQRFVHGPTGAVFWVLPSPRAAKVIRRAILPKHRRGTFSRWRSGVGRHLASYFSTPLVVLARILRHENCDCVLVEEYEFPRFDFAVLLGWKLNLPVYGTFCGALPQGTWRRPLRPLAMKLAAGFAICASSEMRRVVERYCVSREKVQLIQYPVDFSVWFPGSRAESRASLGIADAADVVAYHGSISLWTKGLGVLVDAWELLCAENPERDLRLVLVGTGGDSSEFSEIVVRRRLKGIHWMNDWVADRTVVRRFLSTANVYVFPSRGDACPVSIAEALACGLPVVASRIRGIPDLLPDGERSGGILVPPGQPESLKNAIQKVLDDHRLAEELSRCALKNAEERFSMNAVGNRLLAFLLPEQNLRYKADV